MPHDPTNLLTFLGLVLAVLVAKYRAERMGLDVRSLYSLMTWSLLGALAGGYLVDMLCYHFDDVIELVRWHVVWHEPRELLRLWRGWRSVGGLFGGLLAVLTWRRYRFESTVMLRLPGFLEVEAYWFVKQQVRRRALALADVLLSVVPLAWVLHRVGSTVMAGGPAESTIGFLDLLITSALLVVVAALWNRRFKTGTYVCLVGLTYAPARFALDFLRDGEGRRSSPGFLTPTQWGFALLTLLSFGLLAHLRGPMLRPRVGSS